MNKRTIAILSVAGIILNVIAYARFGPQVATQLFGCQQALYGPTCVTGTSTEVAIGIVLYLAGTLAVLAAFVLGLVKTAQIRRWGWFVAILLLSPLGSLLYGIAGPTERKA